MRASFAIFTLCVLTSQACTDDEGDNLDTGGSGATSTGGSAATSGGNGGADGGMGGSAGGQGGGGMMTGSPGCGTAPTEGKEEQTIMVDGDERSYTIAIPAGLDGLTPVPLIFGFHGFSGTGEAASNYFGLTGSEPAIYVYPQALPLPDQGNGIGWNMNEDGVDIAFVDALVEAIANAHCIDEERIFAAGHSHGASFSNHLACYRPELIRAIAPVAGGGPWAGACVASADTVAAMVIHGTNDDAVSIDAGISSRDHWRERNGCATASSMATRPSPCEIYDGCTEDILWCEHGGGHEWPDFAGDGIRGFFLGQ